MNVSRERRFLCRFYRQRDVMRLARLHLAERKTLFEERKCRFLVRSKLCGPLAPEIWMSINFKSILLRDGPSAERSVV